MFRLLPILAALGLAGCIASPTLEVSSSLPPHALRGRTLAVGGFTARAVYLYPGQTEEGIILMDAEQELQRRLKHSRVLSMAAVKQAVGAPPSKFSPGIPIILGSRRTLDFMRRTRTLGVDYLLWIDLVDNEVGNDSSQRMSRNQTSSSYYTRNGRRYCSPGGMTSAYYSPGGMTSAYYSNEVASRRLEASYSLLDTASGKVVWQAGSKYSRARIHSSMSRTGYPAPPDSPLPPEESELMRKMTAVVVDELPR